MIEKNERIENLDKTKDPTRSGHREEIKKCIFFRYVFYLFIYSQQHLLVPVGVISDLNCYLLKLPNPPGRDAADHYPVFTGQLIKS